MLKACFHPLYWNLYGASEWSSRNKIVMFARYSRVEDF